MLPKEKSGHDHQGTSPEDRAMVSAIFGAVADFAEPAENKLKAVIRAGQIAGAFLAGANVGTSPQARQDEAERDDVSEGKGTLTDRAA